MTRPSMPSWQSVHSLAIQSMAIVVQHRPIPRAWAGPVTCFQMSAADSGERSEAADASAAEKQTIPDGNHGDNLRGVQE